MNIEKYRDTVPFNIFYNWPWPVYYRLFLAVCGRAADNPANSIRTTKQKMS